MRNAFADEVTKLAQEDPRVVLLVGDIGNRLFDNLRAASPERFLNCGVAEANMIGMAAGMAASGMRPVAYTITPFITTRVFEQIRVDLCYQNVPVVVVGTGSGLSYASLGATHHSLEDIAIFRTLPNMAVLAPCDATEVRLALRAALQRDKPTYIRIGKKGEAAVHTQRPDFQIGKGIVLRDGHDVALIATGVMVWSAITTAELLAADGVSARVISMHSIKPLDEELVADCLGRFKVVATVEEHGRIGGLGGAVAEFLADQPPQKARLCRFGTADNFMKTAGETECARELFHLTPEHMAKAVLDKLAACG
jgi:transketolase